MRWKMTAAAPLLVLLILATGCGESSRSGDDAGQPASRDEVAVPAPLPSPPESVPLTVTISQDVHNIGAIRFPDVAPDSVFDISKIDVRTQFKVGYVQRSSDDVFRLTVEIWPGAAGKESPPADSIAINAEATCTNEGADGEGFIERIACSVIEQGRGTEPGRGLVCSATYSGMDDPPEKCEGTIACRKCGSVKVCGSEPAC